MCTMNGSLQTVIGTEFDWVLFLLVVPEWDFIYYTFYLLKLFVKEIQMRLIKVKSCIAQLHEMLKL